MDLAAKTDHIPAQLELLRLSENNVKRLRASVRSQPKRNNGKLRGSFIATGAIKRTTTEIFRKGTANVTKPSGTHEVISRGISTATEAMLTRTLNGAYTKRSFNQLNNRTASSMDGRQPASYADYKRIKLEGLKFGPDPVRRQLSEAGINVEVHNYCGQRDCDRC